jgi:ethanolamine ammonia-lyase small subunit
MDESSVIQPHPGDTGPNTRSEFSRPLQSFLEEVRARTPARILTGRSEVAYRTSTYLELRRDHAIARDTVCAELDLERDLGAAFIADWGLFEVATMARTKAEFLLRPELGRMLSSAAQVELASRCPSGADIQVAIVDGLSAAAIRAQVPGLLPLLCAEARGRGWCFGQLFFIRHGRVGVLNDIGEILKPAVVVLLIGERPGLATAESLSAYMAYKPRTGHDDGRRNLISNIHARGVAPDEAAVRITLLAEQMMRLATSGVGVKEQRASSPGLLAEPPFQRSLDT